MINPQDLIELVDPELRHRSGAVFYTGRAAFTPAASLYVLGLNPGGSPISQAAETIERDLLEWRQRPARWSAYLDESWRGSPPGTYGLQPRILHLFRSLGLDPHEVPASNVVFVRTNNEAALAQEKASLLAMCWPVHQAVIEGLGISTVLCLGNTAGRWVRSLLGADETADEFVEQNSRGWKSVAHANRDGRCVVTVTHPGRADWTNPIADPTGLVREMLLR